MTLNEPHDIGIIIIITTMQHQAEDEIASSHLNSERKLNINIGESLGIKKFAILLCK